MADLLSQAGVVECYDPKKMNCKNYDTQYLKEQITKSNVFLNYYIT